MPPIPIGPYVLSALPLMVGTAMEEHGSTPDDETGSPSEHEALPADLDTLKDRDGDEDGAGKALEELRGRIDRLEAGGESPGSTRFMVSGFGHAGYADVEGENSSFNAQFNPIFLYEINDRLLFEAELEFELEGEGTEVALEFANISYLINDRAAVSIGKFLTPLSHFSRDLHPSWINKLPDAPLYARHGGIVPMSSLGAQITGAAPVSKGGAKIDYAAWVSNGPLLEMEGEHAGQLEFGNSEDGNNSKAVGARIGFSPTASFNCGVGALVGRVDESGSDAGPVDATVSVLDFTYIQPLERLGNVIDVRGEFVRSDVGDPDVPFLDADGAPLPMFDNTRQGGYVQAAMRSTEAGSDFLRDLEFITRFDFLDGPGKAGVPDRDRLTFGIDWWTSPSTVLKLAYRIEDSSDGVEANAVLLQWAMGF